jgi:hypothetical protein
MAGPWEKFQKQTAPSDGPWNKFKQAPVEAVVETQETVTAEPSNQDYGPFDMFKPGPTPLSAIFHGGTAGLSSQFSDEAARALGDPAAVERMKASQEAYPLTYGAANIVGSGLQALATAPLAAARGIGLIGQGAIQGGLAGLGSSEKESVEQTAKDTAIGAGLGAAFSWGLNKLFGKGPAPIQKAKDGSYNINVGQKTSDVFNVSRETAESMATPEAQNALRAELNAAKDRLSQSVDLDFAASETLKQTGLQSKAALPAKGLQEALDSSWERISAIKPEGDEVAMGAMNALKDRFKDINMNLLKKSSSGKYDDVTLEGLEKVRGELGDIIFRSKAYDKVPQVKGAAVNLWGKLTDVLKKNDIDPITKEAGDLTRGLNAQRALFQVKDVVDELPSGDWIKGLANPSNSGAYERFKNLVKPLEDLAKKGEDLSLSNLANYISGDFNKTLLKARISNKVLGEVGSSLKTSPKQAINSVIQGYKNDVASKMGATLGELDQLRLLGMPVGRAVTAPVDAGLTVLGRSLPAQAGSLGAPSSEE